MAYNNNRALNIGDLREMSRRRLPKGIFEFIDRGNEDDIAIGANKRALSSIMFRPHVLSDVSARHQRVQLFGETYQSPFIVAPTGLAGLLWHEGELLISRAAAAAGIPFVLSTASVTSLERVAEGAGGQLWFQLYMWPDREMSFELVRRVERAGYKALVVTVDTAVGSNREFNSRNGFSVPFKINSKNFIDIFSHPRWLVDVIGRYLLTTGMPRFENYPEKLRRSLSASARNYAPVPRNDSLSWNDLKVLREMWKGPLIVKGILRSDDAAQAVACGADAIVVSNHGGRNLDNSIPPILALPEIVDRVGAKTEVLIDSGFSRGSDIVKALALGAKAALVGRAPLWGVAAGGQDGANRALQILKEEVERVIGQLGCTAPSELNPDLLHIDSPLPYGWKRQLSPQT